MNRTGRSDDRPIATGGDGSPRRSAPASATAVAVLALGALGVWVVWQSLALGLFNALGVGPGLFPFVSGLLLALLGSVGAGAELWRLRRGGPTPEEHHEPPAFALFEGQLDLDAFVGTKNVEEHRGDPRVDESWNGVRWSRFWIAAASLGVFVFVMDVLGFILAITLLTFALLTLVARRSLLTSAAVALSTGAVVWWGFGELLSVRFPEPTMPFLQALLG